MLKSNDTNFLNVTINVTASDEHSVVRTKTALMHMDLDVEENKLDVIPVKFLATKIIKIFILTV